MKTLLMMLALFSVALVGCNTTDYTLTKRSAIDAQIAAARVETTTQLNSLNTKQIGLLQQVIAEHKDQLQSAANYLFKGSVVGASLRDPTRPEMVMVQSINQTSAQLPPATPAAQAEALKALQTELDEAKITNAQLKAQYEAELGQARQEAQVKDKALTDLTTSLHSVDQERVRVLDQARQTEANLSDARKKASDEEVAAARAKADKAVSDERNRRWLMGILLSAAAACALGAAFLPIPSAKSKLVVGAAICGGGAIVIPFLTPVFVMAIVGVCVLGVGTWLLMDYHHEHSDATDTYRALQQVKTQAPEVFKTAVAPALQEWHTDPKTGQRIDNTLKQVGDV